MRELSGSQACEKMRKKTKKKFFTLVFLVSIFLVTCFLIKGRPVRVEAIIDIVIQDNFAFACSYDIFMILDVSYPDEISEVSTLAVGGYDLFVTSKYACVLSYDLINIIDISNKSSPILVNSIEPSHNSETIWIKDNYVFAGGGWGIEVVNITNPKQPSKLSFFETCTNDIAISTNFAYVVGGNDGFRIVDINDLSNLVIVDSISTPYCAQYVYVEGNYSYVLCDELRTFDCSTKTDISLLGVINTPGGFDSDLVVKENYTYVATNQLLSFEGGISVFDTSNLTNIALVNSFPFGETSVHSLAIKDNYIFLSCGYEGLFTIDITNPENPIHIGTYTQYYQPTIEASKIIPSIIGIIIIVAILGLIYVSTMAHKPDLIAKHLERTRSKANALAIVSGALSVGLMFLIFNLIVHASDFPRSSMIFISALLSGFLAGWSFGFFASKRDVVKIVFTVSLLILLFSTIGADDWIFYFGIIGSGTSFLVILGGGIGFLTVFKLWKDESFIFPRKSLWKLGLLTVLGIYTLTTLGIFIWLIIKMMSGI